MNIAITGVGGFLGAHLLKRFLDNGDTVYGIDLYPRESPELYRISRDLYCPRFEYIWGGVQDIGTLLNHVTVDVIIHAAATSDVPFSSRSPIYAFDQIMHATMAVANFAAERNIKLINISTFSVYGEGHQQPMIEDLPLRPGSPYGASKAAAEHWVTSLGKSRTLDAITIRPASMYGENERHTGLVSMLLKRALTGHKVFMEGDGEQTRDFNYVGNVVDFIQLALARWDTIGTQRTFNVGSGTELSIRELLERVAAVSGREFDNLVQQKPARAWEEGRIVLDISHARELGYEPKVSFDEGFNQLALFLKGAE
ncbi:MAG: UDP-glucose 4-epimerase [Nitrosomonadaceae bacterium]|nr:UDP-glucose 4-epimerase [Nitrosomonadaceae bacterium]